MTKTQYEYLKSTNYDEAAIYLINLIRDRYSVEASTPIIVGISTLAMVINDEGCKLDDAVSYLKKNINDVETLLFIKKIEEDYGDQIEELARKFETDILKAVALFVEPKRFSEADLSSTPEGISNLTISLLSPTKDDVILDLGSGVSSYLIQAAYESRSTNIYGVEIDRYNVIVSNLRAFITGLPIKVITGNIISQDYSTLSANKVFSNYPLGVHFPALEKVIEKNPNLIKYFKEAKRTVTGDWVYGIASYLNTMKPGKTILLMSNAGTWNKPDEQIRKVLVEEGLIEGVISLPPRLFSSTMIPLTMLIMSQNNKHIRMVDASEIYTEGRRQNTLETKDVESIIKAYHNDCNISKRVSFDEIAREEYILSPQRYIGTDTGIKDGIPLADIMISINRGAMIKSNELDELISQEDTNYHYLMLQNIQDGMIEPKLPNLVGIDKKYEKHCIKDGNLIISKTSPFKVAMAQIENDGLVLANGNLYFIELDREIVDPIFVLAYLQSEMGLSQLNKYAKGATMKNISINDLKRIQIPKLSREQQDLIAKEYEKLNNELIDLQRKIDRVHEEKANLLRRKLD